MSGRESWHHIDTICTCRLCISRKPSSANLSKYSARFKFRRNSLKSLGEPIVDTPMFGSSAPERIPWTLFRACAAIRGLGSLVAERFLNCSSCIFFMSSTIDTCCACTNGRKMQKIPAESFALVLFALFQQLVCALLTGLALLFVREW